MRAHAHVYRLHCRKASNPSTTFHHLFDQTLTSGVILPNLEAWKDQITTSSFVLSSLTLFSDSPLRARPS